MTHIILALYQNYGRTGECDTNVTEIKNSIYPFADEILEVGDIVYYTTTINEYIAKSEKTGIEEDQIFRTNNEKVKCIVLRKRGTSESVTTRKNGVEIVTFTSVGTLSLYGKRGYSNNSSINKSISELYTNQGLGTGIAFSNYATSSFSKYHTDALYNLYQQGFTEIYTDSYRTSKIVPEVLDSSINSSETNWNSYGKGCWICDMGVGPIDVRYSYMSTPSNKSSRCYMYSNSYSYTYGYKSGVVPLILLEEDVIITSGNGKDEPYTIEKYREN